MRNNVGRSAVHEGDASVSSRSTLERPRLRKRLDWGPFLYLLPGAGLLGLFYLWPIVFGFWISLWRWGIAPERFVWFENYRRILKDGFLTRDFRGDLVLGEVGQSVINTVYYTIGTVTAGLAIAFVIAYLLFARTPLGGVLRTLYFLPYVTSAAAAGVVFLWIFNPQTGIANSLLTDLGLPPQTWLQDPEPIGRKLLSGLRIGAADSMPDFMLGPSMAMVVVIIFSIWNNLGFNVVIFLAGLTAIPREIDEAARVDGTNNWQHIRHITLPLLSPTTLFLVVVSTIRSFQAFTPIFVLTGGQQRGGVSGGPLGTTRVLTVEIFHNFYEKPGSVGFAAAVAFVLLISVLLLTAFQFRIFGRRTFYG